jgi:hypothetical protein
MQFTNEQKVIVAMLAEVHQALKIRNGMNADLISKAIWTDNTWAIPWDIQLAWDNLPEDPAYVKHVGDVLDMWSFIEEGYEALSAADKQRFANETRYKGAPKFPGFDGNNESDHYSAARFMIEELDRYGRFAGRDLNSHHATVDRSERMLEMFRPMRVASARRHPIQLTVDEIISLVNA